MQFDPPIVTIAASEHSSTFRILVKSSISVLRVLVKFDFVAGSPSELIKVRPIYVWI